MNEKGYLFEQFSHCFFITLLFLIYLIMNLVFAPLFFLLATTATGILVYVLILVFMQLFWSCFYYLFFGWILVAYSRVGLLLLAKRVSHFCLKLTFSFLKELCYWIRIPIFWNFKIFRCRYYWGTNLSPSIGYLDLSS